jgi:Glycosyl transferase family 2
VTTVVIPAHNEGRVIRRLLEKLINGADPGETDIIVVANGCTDDTAEVAASFGPAVRVLTVPVASKQEALTAGDRAAAGFPRIYVDADLELRIDDVRALAAALSQPGVLAAAPRRELVMAGRPWQVRWYYDVWTLLPGGPHRRRAPPAGGPEPCPAHQVTRQYPPTQRCPSSACITTPRSAGSALTGLSARMGWLESGLLVKRPVAMRPPAARAQDLRARRPPCARITMDSIGPGGTIALP